MTQPSIFDPPPIERTKPALEGELTLKNGAVYHWALHPERIAPDWTEETRAGRWSPPGWAFGLRSLQGGVLKPVHYAPRTIEAWQIVRELDEVRAVIDEITGGSS